MPFLTNSGLDQIGTDLFNIGGSSVPAGISFGSYLQVATGAITPSNSTTDLVTPVSGRSNSTGGFASTQAYTADADSINYDLTYTRVIDFISSHTLTHWGLFVNSSGGSVGIVDLFRSDPNDVLSSAVTISVQDGDQLQMTFTMAFGLSPYGVVSDTVALNIDGSETTPTSNSTFYGANTSEYADAFRAWDPKNNVSISPRLEIGTFSATDLSNTHGGTELDSGVSTLQSVVSSYVTGEYQRSITYTFTTSESNGDIYGFYCGEGVELGGFKTMLDVPITKTSLQELAITFIRSWARA